MSSLPIHQKQILTVVSVLTALNTILSLGKWFLLHRVRKKKTKCLVLEIQDLLNLLNKISDHQATVTDNREKEGEHTFSRIQESTETSVLTKAECESSSSVAIDFPPPSISLTKSTLIDENKKVLNIPINFLQKVLVIPFSAVPDEENVRQLYCYACICRTPSVYLVDLWNILCSLITLELRSNESSSPLATDVGIDVHYRVDLLATGKLLSGSYSLNKHVNPSVIIKERLAVVELPRKLIEQDKTLDSGIWSKICTLVAYQWRTVRKPFQHIFYITLFDSNLLRLFQWDIHDNLKTLFLGDIVWGCGKEGRVDAHEKMLSAGDGERSEVTFWSALASFANFRWTMCQHSSRKLTARKNFMSGVEWVLTTLQEAIKKDVLQDENQLLESTSLFALAIQNFPSSYHWELPSLVEESIEVVKAFSEDGINFMLSNVMNFIEDVTAGWSYPLQCFVAWNTAQFVRYLENKLFSIVALVSECMNSDTSHATSLHPYSEGGQSSTKAGKVTHQFDQSVDSLRMHIGLSLLLLVCSERKGIADEDRFVLSTCLSSAVLEDPSLTCVEDNVCLIPFVYLALFMVIPCQNSCLIKAISLPLCEWIIQCFEEYKHKLVNADDYIFYFSSLREDLCDELDKSEVAVDLSVSSDLFLLHHRSGVSFTQPPSPSPSKSLCIGPFHASFASPNARKTLLDVLNQCIGRADALPLSLALAVSDTLLSPTKKQVGEPAKNTTKKEKTIASALSSHFFLPFTSSCSASFAYMCDRIHMFSERFLPVVTPVDGYMRRLGTFVQYEHSTHRKGNHSYSFHMNLLQALWGSHSPSTNEAKHFPSLIDDKLWVDAAPLIDSAWSVEFKNVCFSYPNSNILILDNISFRLEAGQKLGIIGYSGAGKTTILLLINRIYSPKSGVILINNKPIQQYAARGFRRRLSFAFQDSNASRFFESMDIQSNIALGDLVHSTAHRIEEALKISDALNVVQRSGRGLEGMLDFKKFSGGELERINLARAVLRSMQYCCLLMLDESMCALDSITEERITKSLEEQWENKKSHLLSGFPFQETNREESEVNHPTIITVTHRLYSVKDYDLILLMVNGKVEERGTWSDLFRSSANKNFHKLLRSQQLWNFDTP